MTHTDAPEGSVYRDKNVTIYLGDCRTALAGLADNTIDSIVTDPPYELSNDGKASAARVLAEVVFPQDRNRPTPGPGECNLGFLATKVADLCGGRGVPCPPATMPVGAVALNDHVAGGDDDVEHGAPPAGDRVTPTHRGVDGEPQPTEHLGCFLLKLADTEAGVDALHRSGTSFDAGGFRVGLSLSAASLAGFARSGLSVPLGGDDVGPLDHTLAALVGASTGTEELSVSYPLLTRGTDEDRFTAGGALAFVALAKASGAQLVPAGGGTGEVPSDAEPRRIRVVGPSADRAFTFDLLVRAHMADVTSVGFMGRAWDGSKVAYDVATWREAFRLLKPGGHLLAFGSPRTYHRMAVAIEDAGFEIRDSIHWVYGSGFPKSLDVSKAIDKAAGAEREVIGTNPNFRDPTTNAEHHARWNGAVMSPDVTAPATPAAAEWDGWGTALKPSHEPIVLARKPLAGTVAENVLAHGTGAINIDATRVATGGERVGGGAAGASGFVDGYTSGDGWVEGAPGGRWPSNLLLGHAAGCRPTTDTRQVRTGTAGPAAGGAFSTGTLYGGGADPNYRPGPEATYGENGTETVDVWECEPGCPIAEMDAQSGESTSPTGQVTGQARSGGIMGAPDGNRVSMSGHGDSGGASRFFPRFGWEEPDDVVPFRYVAKAGRNERPSYTNDDGDTVAHPTVKPLDLIRWLIRLVTPPGGTVLDLFAGSGTTAEAAILERFHMIGVELDEAHLPLIEARIERGYRGGPTAPQPVQRATPVDDQPTLF